MQIALPDTVLLDAASVNTLRVLSDTLRLSIEAASGNPSGSSASWLAPALIGLLGALAGAAGALVGAVVVGRYQKRALDQSHEEKRREEERADIYRKLNEFYGPVSVLLYESEMWHALFKHGADFRTLIDLIDGHRFTGDNKVLLDEIMRTTDQISAFIVEKGGLVEEEPSDLTELLSKARTHYRLLRLAADRKLTEDAERYAGYVYPKTLDSAIRSRKAQLEARLRALNGTPPPTSNIAGEE